MESTNGWPDPYDLAAAGNTASKMLFRHLVIVWMGTEITTVVGSDG